MGGGLVDLVSYGAMNAYLNASDINFSYFKKVYIQHTPFLKYNKDISSGIIDNVISPKKRIIIHKENGDLLSDLYIEIEIVGNPDIKQFIRGFATGLIESVELIIGGMSIDKINTHQINIYNELWLKEAKRQYNDYLCGNKVIQGQRHFIVKLPFYFTKSLSKSIPLCALNHHNVEVVINFNNTKNIISNYQEINYGTTENNLINNISRMEITNDNMDTDDNMNIVNDYDTNFSINYNIIGEFILLSDRERNMFMNNSLEYVIEQHQYGLFNIKNNNSNIQIPFNFCIKELNFVFQYLNNNKTQYNDDLLKYVDMNNTKFKMQLNGLDRFSEQSGQHFLIEQNSKYHSNIPRTKTYIPVVNNNILQSIKNNNQGNINIELIQSQLNKAVEYLELDDKQYIYTYSFAQEPENSIQETGCINASRIDTFNLKLNIPNTIPLNKNGHTLFCHINAKSINILRIMSGMGGLAFST